MAPDKIRVAQDADGFWTCREAVSGSQEYVRGDIVSDLIEILQECEEYFDNRADADCDQDGFIPNEEMKLLSAVREALSKAEGK